MSKIRIPTVEELFDAGVHFGHHVRRWHPSMQQYIYAAKNGVHIIDLEETERLLKEAANFLYEIAKEGKSIIFVGTKKQSNAVVELEAKRCGAKYVTDRWLGGTITNFGVIAKNIKKFVNMLKDLESGEFRKYTKKEQLLLDREIKKLRVKVGGLVGLDSTPGALFVIDPKREKTAVREARRSNIPVVALVDTNSDPLSVDYPIPGNDDAIKSTALIVKTISDAVEEGYKEYGEAAKRAKEKELKEEKVEKNKDDSKKEGK